ncbi:MAG TPA: hypothetical protein VFC82_11190 [Actinomycetaceae bacterium]|nr:hypothetical protein [Actinomycetaceae bacterium]
MPGFDDVRLLVDRAQERIADAGALVAAAVPEPWSGDAANQYERQRQEIVNLGSGVGLELTRARMAVAACQAEQAAVQRALGVL